MVSTVSSMMERSLSFKNWETDDKKLEISVVGELKKNEGIVSPKTSTINRPAQTVSLSIQTQTPQSYLPPSLIEYCSPKPKSELDAAATYVQKVFKSYRTRRNLADCAVIVEEFWWKALDFTSLQLSSVSFFDVEKPQTAVSRWTRATNRLAKVGKGLSKDEKAQSLALQHWLEAIDPRHRYGHNLHFYYDVWSSSESSEPFFWWLDIGEGKEVNIEKCPRNKLQQQLITYLGPKEREAYEVIVDNGKLVYKITETPVNTTEGSKWIFVLSASRQLYVGQKKKGSFQHSSFLAGASTTAAGRLVAEEGVIKAIWPYSGHYLPTQQHFREFISFLQEHNVELSDVKKNSIDDDDYSSSNSGSAERETEMVETLELETAQSTAEVAETEENKTERPMALELNRHLTCRWATGTGARIGCVRDYPAELQSMALEHVNLSPSVVPSPASSRKVPIPSPRPSPKMRLSPRLQYMGIPMPSPRPSYQTRLSPHIQYMGIPMPSPRPSPLSMGIRNPNVSLTLPKHMRG